MRLFVKALFFSLLLGVTVEASVNQKGDIQFWSMQQISTDIRPKTNLYFQTEFRWGDDVSTLYLTYLQAGMRFTVTDWLGIGPGYRESSILLANRSRIATHQPFLDVTLTHKRHEWKIRNNHRFERIITDNRPDAWLYRFRVDLISPWEWGRLKFKPVMHDELFFLERRGFSQNRLAFGGIFNISKEVRSHLFYMLRHIKPDEWRPTHVIGAYLFFKY